MTQQVRPRDLPETAGASLRFDASAVNNPGVWLFDPSTLSLQAEPVQQGGRQAAWFVQGDFGLAVLRQYRRGGLIARLSPDRYVWSGAESTRSFAEFNLLQFMHDAGLPVPRPLAAAYWRHGLSYRAAILVERIEGVKPLAGQWATANPMPVAQAILAMHDAGVWHADLNAYNILLDEQGKTWLIDFDKGSRQNLSGKQRNNNLLRLRRSLLKVAGEQTLPWWTELNRVYWQMAAAQAPRQP